MDKAWRSLHERACRPYRGAGRFAWHFARGKLAFDPVFRAMISRGLLPARARVLDLGCGQGLLASLLAAVDQQHRDHGWPADWAQPPVQARYTGVELMPRDVARARAAFASSGVDASVLCGDIRQVALPVSDVVVILDVLHYFPHAAQAELLQRVRHALGPAGRLLLRIGDPADRRRFRVSQWVDRTVTRVRGHRVRPTFCRPLDEWRQLLESLNFRVRSLPMSQGTPFANVLLVADLGARPGETS
jgi:SAM-dependent methyltransferase